MTWKRFYFSNPPFSHFLTNATKSQRLPQPLETQNKSPNLLFFAFLVILFPKKVEITLLPVQVTIKVRITEGVVKESIFSQWLISLSKRTPFTLQKDSFYTPKGLLLHNKCTPFGMQKGYICFSSVIFGLFSQYFSAFQPLFIGFSAAVCQLFSRRFYTKWAMRSSRSPSSISITGTSIIV